MGAPDLASWIWPDASQGRAPTSAAKLDRSNPLLAGLADYIIPADPSTFSVASGSVAYTNDLLGRAFSGTMRLDGKKSAVTTSAPYTLICIARMPATLSGTLVACSLEGTFAGSASPWMGYNAGEGVVVSNSDTDSFVAATASTLYVLCGVYSSAGYTAYFNGAVAGTVTSNPSTGTTGTLCVMDYNGGGFSYTGNVLGALAFNRALSPAEIGALGTPQAVFSLFQPTKLGVYMPASGSTATVTASSVLGGLSSSASATQSSASVASPALGTFASPVTATESQAATGSSTLGSLASTATAVITAAAIAASSLGDLSSSSTVTQSRSASPASAFGALSTAATATESQAASGNSTLGALSSSVTANNTGNATANAVSTLGGLASTGQATQSASAVASPTLGQLASTIVAARSQTSVSASTLGGLSSSVSAIDIPATTASASGVLGGLLSGATATQQRSASASSAFALSSQVTVSSSSQAGVSAPFGPAQSAATLTQHQASTASGTLGALSSSAVVVPPYTAVVSGLLGALSSSISMVGGYKSVDPLTVKVPAESRSRTVAAESRALRVPPESRSIKVAA